MLTPKLCRKHFLTSERNRDCLPNLDPRYGGASFGKRGRPESLMLQVKRLSTVEPQFLSPLEQCPPPWDHRVMGVSRASASVEEGIPPTEEATPSELCHPGVAPGGNSGGCQQLPPTSMFTIHERCSSSLLIPPGCGSLGVVAPLLAPRQTFGDLGVAPLGNGGKRPRLASSLPIPTRACSPPLPHLEGAEAEFPPQPSVRTT